MALPALSEGVSRKRLNAARLTAQAIVGALLDAEGQAEVDAFTPAARRAIAEYAARCRKAWARLEPVLTEMENGG